MNETGYSREMEPSPLPVEVKFYPEFATSLLTIDKNAINTEIKKTAAERSGLSEKDEFHITLIGFDTGIEILKSLENLSETKKSETLDKIRELCESSGLKITMEDNFYSIEKSYDNPDPADPNKTIPEKRRSIVQTAQIDGLNEFYRKLNSLLDKNFETPFPHVTLYTTSDIEANNLRGIGIYSKKQFDELRPAEK